MRRGCWFCSDFSPFRFLRLRETESTWYAGHCLALCTSHGWWWMMMSVEQTVEWLGRGNRSTRRNLAPELFCIPYDLTWDRTQAAEEESRRLRLSYGMAIAVIYVRQILRTGCFKQTSHRKTQHTSIKISQELCSCNLRLPSSILNNRWSQIEQRDRFSSNSKHCSENSTRCKYGCTLACQYRKHYNFS
jgi:hypothetical protein